MFRYWIFGSTERTWGPWAGERVAEDWGEVEQGRVLEIKVFVHPGPIFVGSRESTCSFMYYKSRSEDGGLFV